MIVFRNMAVDILTESGTLCSELVHTEPISVPGRCSEAVGNLMRILATVYIALDHKNTYIQYIYTYMYLSQG